MFRKSNDEKCKSHLVKIQKHLLVIEDLIKKYELESKDYEKDIQNKDSASYDAKAARKHNIIDPLKLQQLRKERHILRFITTNLSKENSKALTDEIKSSGHNFEYSFLVLHVSLLAQKLNLSAEGVNTTKKTLQLIEELKKYANESVIQGGEASALQYLTTKEFKYVNIKAPLVVSQELKSNMNQFADAYQKFQKMNDSDIQHFSYHYRLACNEIVTKALTNFEGLNPEKDASYIDLQKRCHEICKNYILLSAPGTDFFNYDKLSLPIKDFIKVVVIGCCSLKCLQEETMEALKEILPKNDQTKNFSPP